MKFGFLSLVLAMFLAFGLGASPVAAQNKAKKIESPKEIRVGVLDIERVKRSSKMGKDIVRQRNELGKIFQQKIQTAENELRKQSEELKRKSTILQPEAMQQERLKFRQKQLQLQTEVQNRQRELASITAAASRAFEKEVEKAIIEASNRSGLTLILKKSSVFLRADFLDVTPEIISIVDRNIPKYKLPAAAAKTSAAPAKSGK